MKRWIIQTVVAAIAISSPLYCQDAPAPKTDIELPWGNDIETHKKEAAQESQLTNLFSKMIGMLFVTLLGVLIFAWVAKRYFSSRLYEANRASRIQLLEKRMLSPKACLYLIDIDGKKLLIGESSHTIVPITDFSEKKHHE